MLVDIMPDLAWIVHANLLRTRISLHLSRSCQNADLDGGPHASARQPGTARAPGQCLFTGRAAPPGWPLPRDMPPPWRGLRSSPPCPPRVCTRGYCIPPPVEAPGSPPESRLPAPDLPQTCSMAAYGARLGATT